MPAPMSLAKILISIPLPFCCGMNSLLLISMGHWKTMPVDLTGSLLNIFCLIRLATTFSSLALLVHLGLFNPSSTPSRTRLWASRSSCPGVSVSFWSSIGSFSPIALSLGLALSETLSCFLLLVRLPLAICSPSSLPWTTTACLFIALKKQIIPSFTSCNVSLAAMLTALYLGIGLWVD